MRFGGGGVPRRKRGAPLTEGQRDAGRRGVMLAFLGAVLIN